MLSSFVKVSTSIQLSGHASSHSLQAAAKAYDADDLVMMS
jgi:hypothetical protein